MSAELLPCPMLDCGSTLVGTGRLPCGVDTVCCGRCGLSIPATDDATAPERWNRRAPVAAPIDAEGLPALPDHPEPRVMQWSSLEKEAIRQSQRDAKSLGYALGRGAAVREYVEGRSSPEIPDSSQVRQSVDTPEFRKVMQPLLDAFDDFDPSKPVSMDACQAWTDLIAYIDGRTAGTAEAVPNQAPAEDAPRSFEWQHVTAPGQVRKGDKLRFKIGDKEYSERAKLILEAGTDKEEVVYDMGRNFYFITSMIINGRSNHKHVEVLAAAPSPNSPQEGAN